MPTKIEYFGKFILLKRIGEGGMGSVYLARTRGKDGINKNVAIKMMSDSYIETPKALDMFRHEAALAIKFNHANIVGVHEFGMINNQWYVAMDYVSGENLRYLIENLPYSSSVLRPQEILYIAKNVAQGLDYLHRFKDPRTGEALQIVHRDINPHNVMVNFEGEIKIIDFGVAKTSLVAQKTFAQRPAGKIRYMSPEQINGEEITQATDLFCFGLILWEMIAGRQIFEGLKKQDVLEKLAQYELPHLPEKRDDIPLKVFEILKKATAKDKTHRYSSANQLLREITSVLNTNYPTYTSEDFRQTMAHLMKEEMAIEENLQRELAHIGQPITEQVWMSDQLDPRVDSDTSSLIISTQSDSSSKSLSQKGREILAWFTKTDTLKAFTVAALLYFAVFEGGSFLNQHLHNQDSSLRQTIDTVRYPHLMRNVRINSEPGGATVYLNGESTNQVTPTSIQVHQSRKLIVTLKKDGYLIEQIEVDKDISTVQVRLSEVDPELPQRVKKILEARKNRLESQTELSSTGTPNDVKETNIKEMTISQ